MESEPTRKKLAKGSGSFSISKNGQVVGLQRVVKMERDSMKQETRIVREVVIIDDATPEIGFKESTLKYGKHYGLPTHGFFQDTNLENPKRAKQ